VLEDEDVLWKLAIEFHTMLDITNLVYRYLDGAQVGI